MSTNATILICFAIAAALAIVIFLTRESHRRPKVIQSADGPRHTIDIRDFLTKYSGYSVELEASVGDKTKVSTKLTPGQLQQMSESLQSANEFRKYVVAGYNACAISEAQFAQYGERFQKLDALSRQINAFLSKPSLAESESADLSNLVKEYVELTKARAA